MDVSANLSPEARSPEPPGPGARLDVSIVIPVYNALPVAKLCLESIYTHGSTLRFEVIFVDNGSRPDMQEWLTQQQAVHTNLRSLRYPAPLGFARAINLGTAVATGDILVALNSDTIVTPRWMEGLHQALMDDPSLGAITPSTNHAGEAAQIDFGTIDLPPAKALAMRAARNVQPAVLYLPQRITYFCVAFRRATLLAIGGFEEAYAMGNFEDDDVCLRLRVAGYRLGVALHVFVYHHNNATFSANRLSHSTLMAQNACRFAEFASAAAESTTPAAPRWPRRSLPEISVVILPRPGASLERTLQSLVNQTVLDFEIVLPESAEGPTRPWLAYIHQGDIVYPFHLEALADALDRAGAEAIFADGWVAGQTAPTPHPDAAMLIRTAPSLLAGWMHHASLDPALLWQETTPIHWPYFTWQMQEQPPLVSYPAQKPERGLAHLARRAYRRLLPYETRLSLDATIRKLLRRPVLDPQQARLSQLTEQLKEALAAGTHKAAFASAHSLPPVILFNSVPWNSLVQRQHHFARGLAERGHPIFWVDSTLAPPRNWWTGRPLRQIAPNAYLIRLPASARDIYNIAWSPVQLEAMTAAFALIADTYGFSNAVALVNYPRWQPLASRLRERFGWKIVYDNLDDQRAMADVYKTQYSRYEDTLIAEADLLVTSSAVLQQRMARPSLLLHNAADYRVFSAGVSAGDLDRLPRPIVGFFGALADWLDMELIHAAALRFPTWSFVYIGPHTFSEAPIEAKWLRTTDLPNITVLPQMDHAHLTAHLADFNVCTMPFLDIPVTRAMNAVKLYEYLAAGKPALSRDLPAVRHLLAGEPNPDDLILLYKTPEQFFARLEQALTTNSPTLEDHRRNFAQRNDWSQRIDILSNKIAELH